LLYSELAQLCGSAPKVFCFDNIIDAFKHFSDTTKIRAQKLPTPEETKQIKQEQASLPRLDWLRGYDDGGYSVLQNAFRMRESATLRAAFGSPFMSDEIIFPTQTNQETDEKP
jgi:hypothetical protein